MSDVLDQIEKLDESEKKILQGIIEKQQGAQAWLQQNSTTSKAEYFRDKVREDMPKTTQKPEVPA